jgi:UDP-N-acetylglucosamine 2-epimerase (non-hydrolysing)/UDP-GlcNAc3NAcA epimerase
VRVLTVIGNRPQFIKASAVSTRLRAAHEEITVHTGQHHDAELSQVFFDELGLPPAEHQLDLGGGSNTAQTARMLAGLEPVVTDVKPDAVLVYGDTNSTLAGGLAAVQAEVPVVHVEAGMRSFDRAMPEEVNRVLTDHLASLLLCSSDVSAQNLARENAVGRVEVVGDVMVDVAALLQPRAREHTAALEAQGVKAGEYLLITAHRAGNVDDPARLAMLVDVLSALPAPAVLPLHPRTRARLEAAGLLERVTALPHLRLAGPLGYLEFTSLLVHARAVVTDSGGVQKEAYLAGVPCVTLRPSTEWTETVEAGWNELVDLDPARVLTALERRPPAEHPELYGDGRAGERVVAAIERLGTADT